MIDQPSSERNRAVKNRPDAERPEKDRKVFLDGVRGWAALMVVLYHTLHSFPVPELHPDSSRLLHFLSDGPLAVYIFFVLSGFVLSTGFLETGDRKIIVTAALRRYPRLTIPVFGSCLIAFFLMKAGLMLNQPAALAAGSGDWLAEHYNFVPTMKSFLTYTLWAVYFDGGYANCYNAVLWTMPLEMFGSMLVFALLYIFGMHTLRHPVNALTVVILIQLNSHLVSFLLGMALAEIYRFPVIQRFRRKSYSLWIGLGFVTAGFLASTGSLGEITTPPAMSLIAACFVFAVVISRRLASIFETPLSRFVGRLSFPVYVIHLVFICSASSWVYLAAAHFGLAAAPCAIVAQLFTMVGALAVAVAFEPVERFSVRASRIFAVMVTTRASRALSPARVTP